MSVSPRLILVVIASLFVLPLAVAWLMYADVIDYRPGSTNNLGHLLQPPVPLDWEAVDLDSARPRPAAGLFAGHWVVLHVVPHPCADPCRRILADLRQVHRATGRQQSRVRLAVLRDSDSGPSARDLQEIYALLQPVDNPDGTLWRLLGTVADREVPPAPSRGSTYLIDPLGNIMMFYAAGYDPNDLKSDLQRLLTWSKQDEPS